MDFKEMIRSFVEERGVLGALRFRIDVQKTPEMNLKEDRCVRGTRDIP